ncbi:fimbria/pilus outer membrane usher protein [Novosphingobium guangzhouense]|uniref:Pilus assembly protein PapC n=1 Tax=Novosphingobium guangzhouense TaxID=1850347 RepID=A0A2K2FT03_9SPHN|nr:fimbria/pilus outer membrane usher protein [Novosphingobium guangzhouense]PNU01919.1 pilus assembly protein PapC [Novosphingobium guangzhouense]
MKPAMRRWVAALVAALALPPVSGAGPACAQQVAAIEPLPVGVVLNGQTIAQPGLLVIREGRLLARRSDMESWGLAAHSLNASGGNAETFDGESYVALDRVKGLVARLDGDGATLLVDADVSLFPRFTFDPGRHVVPLAQTIPAQFLDYDMTLSDWNGHARLGGFVDAGLSGPWGVADSSFLVDSDRGGVVRLDTALRRDFPERRMRLVVGDAVGAGAPWSRPVRYGGVFLGTDFSLDPQSINFPLPVISGSALTASTVELMAQASRQSMDVGPGAFDLTLQPRLTGAGQVTMSVRDMAGNTRQVTRSFYASPSLLRPGLTEFAFEAGALRKGFGFDSFAYGPMFAAGGVRRGITSRLTLEGRIEVSGKTRMAGLGGAMVIGAVGEVSVAGAVSQGVAGTGVLVRAQAQRVTPVYTLTASYERADARFRQVGEGRFNGGGRSELAVAAGVSLGDIGSLNASYARLTQGIGAEASTRFDLASAYYTANIRGAYLSAGVQYTAYRDGRRSTGLFGSLTVPLGPRRNASIVAEPGRAAATFNQSLPDRSGFGLRALAGRERGEAWVEGGIAYRSGAGDIRFDAAQRRGQSGAQLNVRGSLLRVDGNLVAGQHLDDGFALVEVESDTPVTVTVENRPRPTKAAQGKDVIVTGLQPYAENRIGVDAADVPIQEDLDTAQHVVAPGWRQAVRVRFGTIGGQGLRLRVLDTHGVPVQTGSSVAWAGGLSVVGHDGEVWLEGYRRSAGTLTISGDGGLCRAAVPVVADDARLAATAVTCVRENERT